jgi:hypothetical protein
MPFKKTAQTPSHGTPAESDDVTGGLGWQGLAELQRFVEDGGLLATLGNASALPLEGGMVRGVRRAARRDPHTAQVGAAHAAWSPGSELRASFAREDHPLAYGYGARTSVFRGSFPVYDVPRRWLRMAYCTSCLDGPEDRSAVVLEWGDRDGRPMLVSGGLRGEDVLAGKPAILDFPVGRGRVIAFNFNPVHRDLNRSDYRLLWNAVLHWRAILEPR